MSGAIRFVTAPAAAPVTVLDINQPDDGMYVLGDDFDLGAPQWQTEPGTVGGDDGYREVSMTVAVDGSYTDAADAYAALGRVLQRRDGWLMVQRGAEYQPMFLRWYRTAPQPLDWQLWHINTYRLRLTLTCDPYLYGAPITLPDVTISNRPDSGTNRMFVQWPAATFKGDAPAPLRVSVAPSGDWHGYQPLMATAALEPGQAQSAPYWYDLTVANGWDAGSNVGADVSAAGFVGGSYREFTSGGTLAARLTGDLTPAPPPGTYKALLRVATTGDDTTFDVRLGQYYSGTQIRYGDTKTLVRPLVTTDAYHTWMDLGEFGIPFGAADLDVTDIGTVATTTVEIQAAKVGGASLRFDALLLIPVDTAATTDAVVQVSRFRGLGLTTTRSGVWDGFRRRFAAYDSGSLANLQQPEVRGGWLRVTPGVANVFHLIQQTQVDTPADTTVDDDDEIVNTAVATFTYYPRYLHLAPDGG